MKRKCTYILIGLLCFLGFSGEVNADYKRVCKYETSFTQNEVELTHFVELYYDKNNEKKAFKIKHMVSRSDGKAETPFEVYFSNKYKQNGNTLFSTGYVVINEEKLKKIEKGQCPSTKLYIAPGNKGNRMYSCFLDDGIKCDAEFSTKTNQKINSSKIAYPTQDKVDGYNIKDDDSCRYNYDLKGDNCANNKDCNVSLNLWFKYNSSTNNLDIEYNTKMGATGEFKPITKDPFTFHTAPKYNINNSSEVISFELRFDSSRLDLPSDIKVSSREDFNKKFLKLWEENGKCPATTVQRNSKYENAANKNYFFVLLPDATKYFEENGSDVIDSSDLSGRDWNVTWPDWPSLTDTRDTYDNCEGLLGENLIATINDVLLYVKILIPVALIAFGLIDFVKAVFSSKEDDMKKAQVKFIKRLIMAVIVFIVPSIINLLMNAVDGIWAHINNSACNIWK